MDRSRINSVYDLAVYRNTNINTCIHFAWAQVHAGDLLGSESHPTRSECIQPASTSRSNQPSPCQLKSQHAFRAVACQIAFCLLAMGDFAFVSTSGSPRGDCSPLSLLPALVSLWSLLSDCSLGFIALLLAGLWPLHIRLTAPSSLMLCWHLPCPGPACNPVTSTSELSDPVQLIRFCYTSLRCWFPFSPCYPFPGLSVLTGLSSCCPMGTAPAELPQVLRAPVGAGGTLGVLPLRFKELKLYAVVKSLFTKPGEFSNLHSDCIQPQPGELLDLTLQPCHCACRVLFYKSSFRQELYPTRYCDGAA